MASDPRPVWIRISRSAAKSGFEAIMSIQLETQYLLALTAVAAFLAMVAAKLQRLLEQVHHLGTTYSTRPNAKGFLRINRPTGHQQI